MAKDDSLTNVTILYGLLPPKKDDKHPQFPFPEKWEIPEIPDFPIQEKGGKQEMNKINKFIKLLRKKLNEKSKALIDIKEIDTMILDVLEDMEGE